MCVCAVIKSFKTLFYISTQKELWAALIKHVISFTSNSNWWITLDKSLHFSDSCFPIFLSMSDVLGIFLILSGSIVFWDDIMILGQRQD